MISAVHEALPQIKTMYLCDIDVAKAEGIAKEYGDSLENRRSRTPSAKFVDRWLNSLFRLLRRCSRLSSLTTRHRWI